MSERVSEAEQKPTTEEQKTPTTEDQQTPSTTEEQQTTKEQEPAAPEEAPAAARPADDRPLVLVTGASGYIAAHVIKQLHEKGTYRIRGTVRDASNEAKTKPIRGLLPEEDPIELVSANLTSGEEWKAAVKGCTYVLHVASPFPLKSPKNEEELTRPAIEGALNVLKACAEEAGSPDRQLKRVVLVSSVAAISNGMDGPSGTYSEENWSDEKELRPYEKSKLLAERASQDFVEKLEDGNKFEFSVVCPAVVMGPALTATSASGSSLLTVSQILGNKIPGVPDIYWPGVDVRDVAAGIIAAMEKPEAKGKRYLLGNEEPLRYLDLAQMIAEEFGPQGYKTPTKPINKVLLWIFSQFDESGKYVRRVQGIQIKYNISRMVSELGITPRPYKATVLDTCYSLIDLGVIRKTQQYLGHPDTRPPTPPEEPKPEESKAEEPKPEEPKAEEPKPEEPKAEEPKTEEPKAEEPKPEEPKPEEPKAEEPKPEEPKAEEPKTEEPKAEEPKPEEPKPEEPKAEEPKAEETKPEEPKAEEPEQKPEESKAEEPKAEDPKPEEPTPEEVADS